MLPPKLSRSLEVQNNPILCPCVCCVSVKRQWSDVPDEVECITNIPLAFDPNLLTDDEPETTDQPEPAEASAQPAAGGGMHPLNQLARLNRNVMLPFCTHLLTTLF